MSEPTKLDFDDITVPVSTSMPDELITFVDGKWWHFVNGEWIDCGSNVPRFTTDQSAPE